MIQRKLGGASWLTALLLLSGACSSNDHVFSNGVGGSSSESDGGMAAIDEVGGAAGFSATGEAGAGGVMGDVDQGGAPTALSVVSTSPEDLATDVERDAPVAVTFTAPLDPDSVTAESFSVTNEDGAVAGKLAVNGTTITFTPAAAYALLAEYTVQLSAEIRSLDGAALDEAVSFEFRARDGKWRTPERLTKPSSGVRLEGSRAGHVVAYWTVPSGGAGSPDRAEAAVFDPGSRSWGKVTTLVEDQAASYSIDCVSLNDSGDAFATFSTASGGAWSRRSANAWGSPHLNSIENAQHCALGNDGTLVRAWLGKASELSVAQLSPTDKWSATTNLGAKTNPAFVRRFGQGFLIVSLSADRTFTSNLYTPKEGWLSARPVGTGAATYYTLANSDSRALLAWTDMALHVVNASVSDGGEWGTPFLLGEIEGADTVSASVGENKDLVVWANSLEVWARLRDRTGAWEKSMKLTSNGAGAGGVVDDAGNALVAWTAESGSVAWRRWAANAEMWSDPVEFKDQDSLSYNQLEVDTQGNVMLVWQNALGVWASRFE